MKSLRKNMFGFAHHALLGVVVIAVVCFAGAKVLTGTHALSPPTVIKVYKQTADGKLNGYNDAKKIDIVVNGNNTTVIQLAGSKDYTNKTQLALWAGDPPHTMDYKGDKIRNCVELLYPQSGSQAYGTIAVLRQQSSTSFADYNVLKSNTFSAVCTPYVALKYDNISGALIGPPAVYSVSQTAYIRDIKIEIAQ